MKRTASLAGVLTVLAFVVSGCGSKPITVKGQDALQNDIHKVREAAAGDSKSALVAAISRLETKTRTEYAAHQLTEDRAAQIDAAAQTLLNDYEAAMPTPTPTPTPSTPSQVPTTTAPPPTTSSPPTVAPTITETETASSPPSPSPSSSPTDTGGLLGAG